MTTSNKHTLDQVLLIVENIVPLLIRSGIGHSEFSSSCKAIFYRQALLEAERTSQKRTDSAISLLSGLHRKDTANLRKALVDDPSLANPPVSKPISVPKQVLSLWLSSDISDTIPIHCNKEDKSFSQNSSIQDQSDQNNELLNDALDANNLEEQNLMKQQSFASLVIRVSKDQHHRSILNELERLGIVEVIDSNTVRLKRQAYTPNPELEESKEIFAQNVADHISAGLFNLFSDPSNGDKGTLEQAVFSDELSIESVNELNILANELWFTTLDTILKRAISLHNKDQQFFAENFDEPAYRFRLGMYSYNTEDNNVPTSQRS